MKSLSWLLLLLMLLLLLLLLLLVLLLLRLRLWLWLLREGWRGQELRWRSWGRIRLHV